MQKLFYLPHLLLAASDLVRALLLKEVVDVVLEDFLSIALLHGVESLLVEVLHVLTH